jgi:hypothetical protein
MVRKALLIGLVILLVLIGVPILMGGMGAHGCDACGPAHALCTDTCSVLPSVLTLSLILMATMLRGPSRPKRSRGYAWAIDPPPRLTF